jgi:hypothetical protein
MDAKSWAERKTAVPGVEHQRDQRLCAEPLFGFLGGLRSGHRFAHEKKTWRYRQQRENAVDNKRRTILNISRPSRLTSSLSTR